MKRILLALAFLLFSASANACDMENVYLVDLRESEVMGKVLGVQYQCAKILPAKGQIILYNHVDPDDYVIISMNNLDMQVMSQERFERFSLGED